MQKTLKGTSLAGGSSDRGRVVNDYYATPPQDTQNFLDLICDEIDINEINTILEPAAGGGHIIDVLYEYFPHAKIDGVDIEPKREDIVELDFLETEGFNNYDLVITNPPFKLAREFITKSLELSNRYVMYYLKIQFLEGKTRKDWFKTLPMKYVYVYSYRSNPLRNGELLDERGKPWSSTMCFAWFVFDKQYTGEPIIRWI